MHWVYLMSNEDFQATARSVLVVGRIKDDTTLRVIAHAKQKRSDRKIDDYYEKIRRGKQEKSLAHGRADTTYPY